MFNVSFCSKIFVNPNKFIKNAKASELAEAINEGFRQASTDLGQDIKPIRRITGKSLMDINYDCFDKSTKTLNTKGLESFDYINGKFLNVTTDSKMQDYTKEVSNYIKKFIDNDGFVCHLFDIFQK